MQKTGSVRFFHSPQAQLLLVNSLTCGLEVCLAAGVTFVPPLLLEAGVEEKFMTMVLGIGPILGLLTVHFIGSASDRWTSKYGRRRPFIWLLSLGVILSLVIISYASHLAALVGSHVGTKVAFLILGIGLLDSCGQVCFTPLEALLSDLFPEGEGCRKAFSAYALTVGLGACIGYLLPSINWSGSWLAHLLGGQEQCLFTLLLLIFTACVFATFFVSEEVLIGAGKLDVSGEHLNGGDICLRICHVWTLPLKAWRMALALRGVCALLPRLRTFCCRVPVTLCRLFVAQLCSWMGLMTFMLFYTDFMGEGLYNGVPIAEPGSEARVRYDEGVRMGSLGLFLQSVTSMIASSLMDRMVKTFGARFVYLASVTCLPLATTVMCFSRNVTMVTASAALTGLTFSVLQILPYTLTSLYHHNRQVFLPKYKDFVEDDATEKERKSGFLKENQNSPNVALFPSHSPSLCLGPSCEGAVTISEPVLPNHGVCLDMAILDSACLLSQVVPSLAMGFIVQLTQSVTAYVASAAAFGFIAIYFSSKVVFDKSDMSKLTPL
ncbi:solute carrier family 45 member 3 [Bombina bombina]|uniref:solute carrier family 45 member 3 n=1 Tax=Bombina bombina TaxID=8345 RepID=UPI00235A7ACA|nr:solute carrier family 45 member 3 [Bombina bombina]